MTLYVRTNDGVDLAVYQHGDPERPTVLCVHGFPDDHTVWEGIVRELATTYHVVTFDVRGSGESGKPRAIADYRLDQLADDIASVIARVAPDGGVHLVGHDWGSVQAWQVATDPRMRGTIASLTSIASPCLDEMPYWAWDRVREGLRGWKALAALWKMPLFMGPLAIPLLGPLICRMTIADRIVNLAYRLEGNATARDARDRRQALDNRAALKIYTANLVPRLLFPSRRHTDVPVLMLAPRQDVFIPPLAVRDISDRLAPDNRVQLTSGGHWAAVSHPAEIEQHISTFVQATDSHQPNFRRAQ